MNMTMMNVRCAQRSAMLFSACLLTVYGTGSTSQTSEEDDHDGYHYTEREYIIKAQERRKQEDAREKLKYSITSHIHHWVLQLPDQLALKENKTKFKEIRAYVGRYGSGIDELIQTVSAKWIHHLNLILNQELWSNIVRIQKKAKPQIEYEEIAAILKNKIRAFDLTTERFIDGLAAYHRFLINDKVDEIAANRLKIAIETKRASYRTSSESSSSFSFSEEAVKPSESIRFKREQELHLKDALELAECISEHNIKKRTKATSGVAAGSDAGDIDDLRPATSGGYTVSDRFVSGGYIDRFVSGSQQQKPIPAESDSEQSSDAVQERGISGLSTWSVQSSGYMEDPQKWVSGDSFVFESRKDDAGAGKENIASGKTLPSDVLELE